MRMHLQTIAWRQAANASHWGGSMLEWAPRNLQSSLLLTPYHATFAEHVGARAPHTAEASAKRACFRRSLRLGIRASNASKSNVAV